MLILLFDVDNTLLNTGGAGIRAIDRALAEHAGLPGIAQQLDMSGWTDPLILRDAFRRGGLPFRQELLEETLRGYERYLAEELAGSGNGHLKPGIPAFLEEVHRHPDWRCGIVTGNTERGAQLKLEAFGLRRHFTFGAYSSDDPWRNNLPPIAAARALHVEPGRAKIGPHVVVIGDTPLDVECARANGASALAVATGNFSRAALAAAGPDLLVADLAAGSGAALSWLLDLDARQMAQP